LRHGARGVVVVVQQRGGPVEHLSAVVEHPRGSFHKRGGDGRVDVVSPLPCPWNYGSVPGTVAADGAPVDVIVLGRRLPAGTHVHLPVVARVAFVDDGVPDDKWVLSATPLTHGQEQALARFFRLYVWLKRGLARVRGRTGAIRFHGVHRVP
jgi:inorganic pyrophosphatase